jgi:hypothetical protein
VPSGAPNDLLGRGGAEQVPKLHSPHHLAGYAKGFLPHHRLKRTSRANVCLSEVLSAGKPEPVLVAAPSFRETTQAVLNLGVCLPSDFAVVDLRDIIADYRQSRPSHEPARPDCITPDYM